jgi:hypothetical protein
MAYKRRRNEVRKYEPEEWEAEQAKFGSKGGSLGRMRQGVWQDAEDFANEMLRLSLKGVTAYSAKSDILTPWKQQMREQREVFVASGTPDPAIRLGMYRRAANPEHPELQSRDGVARARTRGAARSLGAISAYNGTDESGETDTVIGGEE